MSKISTVTVYLNLLSFFSIICCGSSSENITESFSISSSIEKDIDVDIDIGSLELSLLREKLFKLSTCCILNPEERNDTNHCQSQQEPIEVLKELKKLVWKVPPNLMSTQISAEFELMKQGNPLCMKESIELTLLWNSSMTKGYKFYGNGYLKIGKVYYAPDEYCIQGFTESGVDVNICTPDCGKTRACLPKCCPLDMVYNIGINGKRGCQAPISSNGSSSSPIKLFFNPPLYHDFYTQLSKEEISQTPQPHYFLWPPAKFNTNCVLNKTTLFPRSASIAMNLSNYFKVGGMHAIDFRIRKDGAFLYRNVVEKKCNAEKEPKRILCFDGVQDFGSENKNGFTNSEDEMIVFLCNVWNTESNDGGRDGRVNAKQLLYGVLMLTFSLFPLITTVVYVLLWPKQNVHGWTIATTAGALFLMYIFQGSALIIGSVHETEQNETLVCTIVAVVSHFFFLSTFSWLTVMCGDLWWTFRSLTPTNRRSKGMKRFVKYSIFGWGLPLTFVIVGLVLDYVSDDCSSHILPSYGTKSCGIIPSSQGVYIYYPVAILLSLNTIFFAVTCFKLCRYGQNTKFATKKDTNNWQCFSRFTKLFLVMGVSWMFEIISWAVDGLNFRWYWVLFDVINILRAVGIFIVYVCKPDILLSLEDAYPRLKRLLGPFKRRGSEDPTGSTARSTAPQFSNARTSTND